MLTDPLPPEAFNFSDLLAPHPQLVIGTLQRQVGGDWSAVIQPAAFQVFSLYATGATPREAVRAALERYLAAIAARGGHYTQEALDVRSLTADPLRLVPSRRATTPGRVTLQDLDLA